jgi:hypothetical protein
VAEHIAGSLLRELAGIGQLDRLVNIKTCLVARTQFDRELGVFVQSLDRLVACRI